MDQDALEKPLQEQKKEAFFMEQTGTVTVTGGCCGASDNRMYQRRNSVRIPVEEQSGGETNEYLRI